MARARRSGVSLALLLGLLGAAMAGIPAGGRDGRLVAAVGWPTSSLVLSEVMTAGAGASDEFVEIANAGPGDVDLAGLEVVYVTSSGSTVTRKASWTAARSLVPGQHLLLANAAGTYASVADALYSGGLAATGGALALRVVGGPVIDAIGWGDATNAFVEGAAAAPAPAARSSLERRPGGIAGNGTDTNDNASDWAIQPAPNPEGLADPPVTGASLSPSTSPSPGATASPMASASSAPPSPTATPTLEPSVAPPSPLPSMEPSSTGEPSSSPEPSVPPSPSASREATPSADVTPAPTPAPSLADSPVPSVSLSPSPSLGPVITSIAIARTLADGTDVTVEGVLTTDLGVLESGRSGFVQDASGGVGVYLDAPVVAGPPAGTFVRISGSLDSRYGQRTVRVSQVSLVVLGFADLPAPTALSTGGVGESVEGSRVVVTGTVTEPPSALADGTGLTVDDGSGPVRVVATPAALSMAAVGPGSTVVAIGPVGQRDSSGTGTAGYRILAIRAGDLTLAVEPPSPSPVPSPVSPDPSATPTPSPADSAPPSPPGASSTPTPSPSDSASPSPAPSPTESPTSSPSPTPAPSSSVSDIVDARSEPIGSVVRVRGTVTAEAGRLGTPALLAIEDGTAGIVVRLPAGSTGAMRGSLLEVTGVLAAPYGQLEIRPHADSLLVEGAGSPPTPLALLSTELGESVEGGLVAIDVTIDRAARREATGSLTLEVLDPVTGGRIVVRADPSARIVPADLPRGRRAHLVGVAGQRATRSGRLDGYRIWLRDVADITLAANSSPSPGVSTSPSADPGATPVTPIAQALVTPGVAIRVEGTVTVAGPLLDSDGRTVVIQDASAAVAVRLPPGSIAPRSGDRLRVDGRVGRSYGAPRLAATAATDVGPGASILPVVVHTPPGPAWEWRLVRISGTVIDVHRAGDRWRAEIADGRAHLLVVGLPASGIPSTALVEGRRVTIIGIVRRPYPTATDRRFAVEPRSMSDVRLGAAERAGSAGGGSTGSGGTSSGGSGGASDGTAGGPAPGDALPLDVDIATLAEHMGSTVRVGGIVTAVVDGAILLDDGTAVGRVALTGDAASYLDLLAPGDALDALGRVEDTADGLAVRVVDGAAVVRVGDPGTLGTGPAAATPDGPASEGASSGEVAGVRPSGPDTAADDGALGLVVIAILVILVLAAVLVSGAVLHRRRAQGRALAARVAARLAALSTPAATPAVAPGTGRPGRPS